MATHRPQDTASAPEFEFHVALGVLEASEDLAARRRPVTPHALARQLSARPLGPHPTLAQIGLVHKPGQYLLFLLVLGTKTI
jgi:hypothetical protein